MGASPNSNSRLFKNRHGISMENQNLFPGHASHGSSSLETVSLKCSESLNDKDSPLKSQADESTCLMDLINNIPNPEIRKLASAKKAEQKVAGDI